jgi:hypothetical protein
LGEKQRNYQHFFRYKKTRRAHLAASEYFFGFKIVFCTKNREKPPIDKQG